MTALRPVRTAEEVAAARRLFEAYVASLGVDLGYQDITTELATLPGSYAPPGGELLLALDSDGVGLGCVGLRPLAAGCCEMKRLYVAPAGRGQGLGRALVQAAVASAQRLGYREMRLDTLPFMAEAIALYARLGFQPIPPYYPSPVAGTIFMARALVD